MSSAVTRGILRREVKEKRAVARPFFSGSASCSVMRVRRRARGLRGFLRLDLSLGLPRDVEAVLLRVRELLLAVEFVGGVGEHEAVVRIGEPVLEVLDDHGLTLVRPEGGLLIEHDLTGPT